MPGPVTDLIAEPAAQLFDIRRVPVQSCFHNLLMLVHTDKYSGLSDWIYDTHHALTPDEQKRHELIMIGLYYAVFPSQEWNSFPEYLNSLASLPAEALRDRVLDMYLSLPVHPEVEASAERKTWDTTAVLKNEKDYMAFLSERFPAGAVSNPVEKEAYQHLLNPPALQELITSHLSMMWDRFLKKEWAQNEKVETASVEAFSKIDFTSMSKQEAIELISGQPLPDDKWSCMIEDAERIVFIPNVHIGPYLGHLQTGETLYVIFGARSPEGLLTSVPSLGHTELLVRLRALSDDNRLHILKLIAENGELKSQDIIQNLDLSQSAASRHLQQLSATGLLTERRCEGAKCYQLNTLRLEDTLEALRSYLIHKAVENG